MLSLLKSFFSSSTNKQQQTLVFDRMVVAAANEATPSTVVSADDIPTNEEDLDVFVKELMENS